MYPAYGDDVVDALHYKLDLRWMPTTHRLLGRETLVLRAARSSSVIPLDLSRALRVRGAWIDGRAVATERSGSHRLRIERRVRAGEVVRLGLSYAGVPHPVAAPTQRSDTESLGFTPTKNGGAWTMQEPYGAFTWYAVNDEPADKAYYDMTLHVPAPMVGIGNGAMVSSSTSGGIRTTRFHLARPAASYLTTVAFGRYDRHRLGTVDGVPVTTWTAHGHPYAAARTRRLPGLLRWLTRRLGRYPFPTLSIIVVPSASGMETQETITMGDTQYALEPENLLHEISHQWYGDTVTPNDWRDLWMNEGMAMYAQTLWDDTQGGDPLGSVIGAYSSRDDADRQEWGPPGAYRRTDFAEDNVYVPPAKMWDTLRRHLGTATFWRLAGAWPASHAYTSVGRTTLEDWWSRESGRDLHAFFTAWLTDNTDPGPNVGF